MRRNAIVLLLIALTGFALLGPAATAHAQFAAGKDKFLGNIHTKGQTPLNFDKYWNQLTPGNAGKWASCEQQRDKLEYWLWLDRAYSHAKQNGFAFKLHTLVWGHSSGEPEWMSKVPQDEQMDEVIEWFEAVAERYKDIDMIDVVNEPLHAPPSYKDALGGDGETGWDWVIWSFEEARRCFPNSILILNEYNVLNYNNECDNFLKIVRLLQERGLIDAVGLQGHSLESVSIDTIRRNLEEVAATGLDVYISEYEAQGNNDIQEALFKEQLSYFWEHPAVKGITLWGYLEGDMWRGSAYLLAADGVTERPALKWMHEYFDDPLTDAQYRLDADSDGHGTINLTPSGGVYDEFTNVMVTAVPDNGYQFSHWTGDKSGTQNPTTMAMTSNRLLTAHFVEKGYVPQYDLTINVSGSGQVTQTPQGTSFDEGTVVTLTALPEADHRFVGWSGSSQGNAATISVTMNANKTVTATFTPIGGGSCDGETAISMPFSHKGAGTYCWVASGSVDNINSYNMDYLEINGQDFTDKWASQIPAAADGRIHIRYDASVSWAGFDLNGTDSQNPPETPQYALSTHIIGQGNITPASGTYAAGTSVTLTATAAQGYQFSGWSGDASGTSQTITVTMDANKSVVATFTKETEVTPPATTYTLTVNVQGKGRVTPAGGGTYEAGTVVTLRATANSGYDFDRWSGDASGRTRFKQITMDGNKEVTATFIEEDEENTGGCGGWWQ